MKHGWHSSISKLWNEKVSCVPTRGVHDAANPFWIGIDCTTLVPACMASKHGLWKRVSKTSLKARFMGPTWGPSGADRAQMGPMLAPWTLLSGMLYNILSVRKMLLMPTSQWTWSSYNGYTMFIPSYIYIYIYIYCTTSTHNFSHIW